MRALPRRSILASLALSAALALSACQGGDKSKGLADNMSQGSASAPVTVIEYASPTCPHCADWNANVFPAFKKAYIDTGEVRYVLREAAIHGAPDVATFLLARCVGKDKYFEVIDAMMRSQTEIAQTGDVRGVLIRIGQSAGLDESRVNACISDEKAQKAFSDRFEREMKEYDVNGTPTFIINGKKQSFQGPPTLDALKAAIDPLLKKK